MSTIANKHTFDKPTLIIVALVALIGVGGISAWLAMGDKLFWSLIQSGLAWCF